MERSREDHHRNGPAPRRIGHGAGHPRRTARRIRRPHRKPGLGRADPGRRERPMARDPGQWTFRPPGELRHADQVGGAHPPGRALRQHRVDLGQDGSPHRRSADAREPAGPRRQVGCPVRDLRGRLGRPPGLDARPRTCTTRSTSVGRLCF